MNASSEARDLACGAVYGKLGSLFPPPMGHQVATEISEAVIRDLEEAGYQIVKVA